MCATSRLACALRLWALPGFSRPLTGLPAALIKIRGDLIKNIFADRFNIGNYLQWFTASDTRTGNIGCVADHFRLGRQLLMHSAVIRFDLACGTGTLAVCIDCEARSYACGGAYVSAAFTFQECACTCAKPRRSMDRQNFDGL